MYYFKPSRIFSVEDLIMATDGESVRTAGLLEKDENGKVWVQGISGAKVRVDLTENLISINPGASYLLIGEYSCECLRARIVREITFKKYSLGYYLRIMPEYLRVDIE